MLKSQVERLEFIRNIDIIIGIDIAKETHWVRMITPYGLELCKPLSVNNNIIDFEKLEKRIKEIMHLNNFSNIIIGMEPTGPYGSSIAKFLRQVGFYVVNVNSHHVKKSRELDDNSPAKNDKKDALTIANLLKEGRYHDVYVPEGIYADMRILTVTRQEWIKTQTHCINKIINILDQYFPEFQSVFKDMTGKSAMQILSKYPLPEDIVSNGIDTVRENTKIANGKRRIEIKKIVALHTFALNTIGEINNVTYVKNNIVLLVNQLQMVLNNLDSIEKQMIELLHKLPESKFILSIKGIGQLTASQLIGELGDIKRFQDWKQIRKYAGYNLTEQSSGKKKGQTTVSKRGRSLLRLILYNVSLNLVVSNPEMKILFEHFKTRKKNSLKGTQALIAVAMKFLRILHYVVVNEKMYDSSKVLGEYREQQIAA